MILVFATQNKHKLSEIKAILDGLPVDVFSASDFPDLPEIVEDGETYAENALKKARTVRDFTGYAALADDSGLSVEFLDGAPGVYSARFAGPGCTYADNNLKLFGLLKGVPIEKRTSHFICTAALITQSGDEFITEGTLDGYIAFEQKGNSGFGYDPVFQLPDGKTLAELPFDKKNKISHRAKAFGKMRDLIGNL